LPNKATSQQPPEHPSKNHNALETTRTIYHSNNSIPATTRTQYKQPNNSLATTTSLLERPRNNQYIQATTRIA